MQDKLANGLLWYAAFLFSTVCHEAAHAWSALKLGDDTASRGGQVSLNPLPHIRREPLGMVLIPILTWFMGGWIMGWASAPYNPAWAHQYPRRAALMAIAGPAANLCLFLSAALLIRVGLEWHVLSAPYPISPNEIAVASEAGPYEFAAHALSVLFSLNLLLFVFNLIPVPPLDGSNVPLLFLPEKAAAWYSSALRSPIIRLVGLLLILRSLGSVFLPMLRSVASLLYFDSH